MSFIEHCLASAMLLGLCAWASNVWPGTDTWIKAATSRVVWWAAPIALIATMNGAEPEHGFYLGAAAWIGAWIPHTALPDIRMNCAAMITDLVVLILRCMALLVLPAAVFWICGAFWCAMIMAALSAIPCVLLGHYLSAPIDGLRTPKDVAGAAFGFCVGAWLAIAIWVPTPMVDRLQ